VDYQGLLHAEGLLAGPGSFSYAYDLVINGDYCFAARGYELQVLDTPSGPQLPSVVGSLRVNCGALAIAGNVLCTGDYSRFYTIDISHPKKPELLATMDLPVAHGDMASDGNFAYLAAGELGLWIIDIRTPSAPRLVGSIDTPDRALGVAMANGVAYVADQRSLQIIDVSNPAEPEHLGSITGPAGSVTLAGSYAVVAGGPVSVIDISNPAAPALAGTYEIPGSRISQVAMDGNRIHLLGSDLVIADLTNPLTPRITGRLPLFENSEYSIATYHNRALLGSRNGILVVDTSNPRSARPIGTTNLSGSGEKVAAQGNLVCVTARGYGLWVLDASTTNPIIVGRAELEAITRDVAIDSTFAYVATSSGLVVVDIDPRFPPHVLGRQALPQECRAIALEGQMAFIVVNNLGLWIIDVADRERPRVVGSVFLGAPMDVAVRDHCAFVAEAHRGLVVIDASNPSSPVVVAEERCGFPSAIGLQGNDLVHVVSQQDSTSIFDVSEPKAPRRVGGLAIGRGIDVMADERFAYVSTSWGTQVVDLENPAAPIFLGNLGSDIADGLALDGGRLFLSSGGNLEVMAAQCEISGLRMVP
jgi:hypothetical protein